MEELNIKDLEKRARVCARYPELIEIAKKAESLSAALDAASKKAVPEDAAEGCQSLVMIKNRYGGKIFKETIKKFKKEVAVDSVFVHLEPFIQTARQLNFLSQKACLGRKKGNIDLNYADVVAGLLSRIPQLNYQEQEDILLSMSDDRAISLLYIQEARSFIKDVRNKEAVSYTCIRRVHYILRAYVLVIGIKAGINETYLSCADRVREYSRVHAQLQKN